jgi:serine/threonine protein kinase
MCPEQARGEAVDPRGDLFSLGCVLYRLCTGELPFKGTNTLATLSALALEEPPPIRQRNPAVPPPLADLVARLMAKDPARRPSSARVVAYTIAVIEGSLSAVQPTGPLAVRPVTDVLPVTDTATINLTEMAEPDTATLNLPEAVADPAPAEVLPRWAVALVGDGVALLLLLSGLYFVVRTLIG